MPTRLATPLLLSAAALALSAQQPPQIPPPVATPLSYACHYTRHAPVIDGKLDDPAWKQAPWTSDFVDIQGAPLPTPRFRTRVKMLWDDHFLYIAAQLQEPDVKATITQHDAVIFKDNDFEVFVKPLPDTRATTSSR